MDLDRGLLAGDGGAQLAGDVRPGAEGMRLQVGVGEAIRTDGDDGEEGEEPRDVDDSFWACGSDDEEEWEGWQPRRNSI